MSCVMKVLKMLFIFLLSALGSRQCGLGVFFSGQSHLMVIRVSGSGLLIN